MPSLVKVFEQIDGYRNEVIQLQAELTSRIALAPENGGTGEHDKARYTKGLLEKLKPDFLEEIKAPDNRAQDGYRPNLIAKWGDTPSGPAVWALSHLDIVPPGDLALWESDPYKTKVVGDRIIGRGVEDNQHGFVSSYLALKAILACGETLNNPVGLAVVADEETGSGYGLEYVLNNHRDLFKKEDIIIVPDSGSEDGTMIEVAEKSMLWVKFTIIGKQCHASTPEKGKNSLYGAAKLILELGKLKEIYNSYNDLFSPPVSTFEATKIEANLPNINTIPGRDTFYMDCRVLPQYKVNEIISACNEITARVGRDLDLEINVEAIYQQPSTEPTSTDAPVVKALVKAIKKVTGRDAVAMGIGGGTVAAFFRQAGLPAAVWSTALETFHQPNEYCLISSILTDAKIFACLYLDDL